VILGKAAVRDRSDSDSAAIESLMAMMR
jgi:hypothetical protein